MFLLGLFSAALAAGDPGVVLRADVALAPGLVRLADVAELDSLAPDQARRIGAVALGAVPALGSRLRFSQAELAARMARAGFQGLRWAGAPAVSVAPATASVPARALELAARAWVQQQWGAALPTLQLALAQPAKDLPVVAGAYRVQVRGPRAPGPHPIFWVDVLVAQQPVQTAVLAFHASAQQPVWLTRQALPAGARLDANALVAGSSDALRTPGAVPVVPDLPQGRLRRALPAGQVLSAADLALPEQVLAGDSLRVRSGAGAVAIETAGVALAAAQPGQRLRVRLAAGNDVVEARLFDSSLAVVE